MLDAVRMRALLPGGAPLRCFDSVGSTNTLAKQWAREGAPHGAAVLAGQQTAGRGRLGRSFYSPEGGLYLSLIVDSGGHQPGQLTTLAAVAVREAVARVTGQQLRIKWVNDLLLHGLKACGILTEGIVLEGRLARAVIGIGINTGPMHLPEELAAIAGSLYQGRAVDREALAAEVIRRILEGLPQIPQHMAAYRQHCLTLHQRVGFPYEGRQREGVAAGIDHEGALLVDTDGGRIRLLAGEVSLRSV